MNRPEVYTQTNGASPNQLDRVNELLRTVTEPQLADLVAKLDAEFANYKAAYQKQRKKLTGLMRAMFGTRASTRTGGGPNEDAQRILQLCAKGDCSRDRIAKELGCSPQGATIRCRSLVKKGLLLEVSPGVYAAK